MWNYKELIEEIVYKLLVLGLLLNLLRNSWRGDSWVEQ